MKNFGSGELHASFARLNGLYGSNDQYSGAFSIDVLGDNTGTLIERFRINRSGNVGINNSNPVYTLDVNGTIRSNTALALIAGNAPWDHGRITHDGSSLYIDAGGAENGIAFRIDNTAVGYPAASYTERMRILNNGNVGIGLANPNSRLVVASSGQTSGTLKLTASTNNANDNWWLGFCQNGSSADSDDRARIGVSIKTGGAGQLFFTTGLSGAQGERMRIDDVGNVGIGITNPLYTLDINGSFEVNNTAGSLVFVNNGNVGIGTTNPVSRLDINGTIRSTSASICIQGLQNGGTGRGIYWWVTGDSSWSSYFSQSGAGRSIANGTACAGAGFSSYAHRHRVGNDATVGFIWENSADSLLASIRGSDGLAYFAGNVGIGTTNPQYTLDVNGTFEAANTAGSLVLVNNGNIGIGSTTPLSKLHLVGNGTTGAIFMSGNVGIGITNPGFPLEIAASSLNPSGTGNYFTGALSSFTNNTSSWTSWNLSMKANGGIWSTVGFAATSDARIKKDIVDIEDDLSLIQLRQLKPKFYKYIDYIQKGSEVVQGFLSQEVEQVLPHAVDTKSEFIPSIFSMGKITDQVITLNSTRNDPLPFDVGSKVKLFDSTNKEYIVLVKTIIDNTSFEIESNDFGNNDLSSIFVYGHEVDDFKILQKDYIFTVAVSALQEVDRQVQDLKQQLENEKIARLSIEDRLRAAGI